MAEEESCNLLKEWSLRAEELFPSTIIMFAAFSLIIGPTIVLNFLIIFTMYRKPALQKPSFIFLCNLAMADLAVGILAVPITTAWKIAELYDQQKVIMCKLGQGVFLVTSVFTGLSFCTITAATVDRFLALHLHLTYIAIVTTKRVVITCVGLWLATIGLTFVGLIGVAIFRVTIIITVILGIVIMVYCYLKIYLIVRRHHKQIQSQMAPSQDNSLPNIKPFKKTVANLIYVLGTNILSYLPFICTTVVRGIVGDSFLIFFFWNISITLIFVNSAVNPLLYCWRLGEIRESVKETFRNVFCC